MERIATLIERLIAPLRSAVADVVREELRRQHRAIIDAAAAEVKDVENELASSEQARKFERASNLRAAEQLTAAERRNDEIHKRIAVLSVDLDETRQALAREREALDRLRAELAKTQTELAEATKQKPARARTAKPRDKFPPEVMHFPPEPSKTTAEVRADDTKAAKAVYCPFCGVSPGDPCNDKGKRLPVMHPDRYALGRQRARELADGLSRPCPECAAPAGSPCIVNGRKGLHNARKLPIPAPT